MERFVFDLTILDIYKGQAAIHQYNPFSTYEIKLFSRKTQLFPDKLQNLNGYLLKVIVFHQSPFLPLKKNLENHPIEMLGPDVFILKMFAKIMNFQICMVTNDFFFIWRISQTSMRGSRSNI